MPVKDFWTTNLNPITMFADKKKYHKQVAEKKPREDARTSINADLSNNPLYINVHDASNICGYGTYMMRQVSREDGRELKVFKDRYSRTFLLRSQFDLIEKKKEVVKEVFQAPEEYISGKELRKEKAWSDFKLWEIQRKHKLKRQRFTGKMYYYLRSEVENLK
jgi:hypothetical protein